MKTVVHRALFAQGSTFAGKYRLPNAAYGAFSQQIETTASAAAYTGTFTRVITFRTQRGTKAIQAFAATAHPDGRVACWASETWGHRRDGSHYALARAALRDPCGEDAAKSYAVLFHGAYEGDSPTGIRPLALAMERVLFAQVFGDPVDERDRYLGEWARHRHRPPTEMLLTANIEVLAAGSAVLSTKMDTNEADQIATEIIRTAMSQRPRAARVLEVTP